MRICRYVFVLMAVLAPFCGRALARQGPQERHGQIIPCSSDDGEKHYCTADTRYGARLVRQRSQAPCQEGGSWGYDEEGIWVDKGCGGEFTLGRGDRSEEHTSELQSQSNLVCRLLLEKKKNNKMSMTNADHTLTHIHTRLIYFISQRQRCSTTSSPSPACFFPIHLRTGQIMTLSITDR